MTGGDPCECLYAFNEGPAAAAEHNRTCPYWRNRNRGMSRCTYCQDEFPESTVRLHEARCPARPRSPPREVPVVNRMQPVGQHRHLNGYGEDVPQAVRTTGFTPFKEEIQVVGGYYSSGGSRSVNVSSNTRRVGSSYDSGPSTSSGYPQPSTSSGASAAFPGNRRQEPPQEQPCFNMPPVTRTYSSSSTSSLSAASQESQEHGPFYPWKQYQQGYRNNK